MKQARAGHVIVRLAVEDEAVCLQVEDDGVGFEQKQENSRTPDGLGLRTMRERAEALQGQLQIQATPGRGTIVKARLPIGTGETR